MFENIKEHLQLWHILVLIGGVGMISILFTTMIMLGIPRYVSYLDMREMRSTILWAETHSKAAIEIGPWLQKYPEYSEYMLYQKVDEDLKQINVK